MADPGEVSRLEDAGWHALTTTNGSAFYDEVLTDDATMLFPGVGLLDRGDILQSIRETAPWEWYEMHEEQLRFPLPGMALLTYRARARRSDQPPYEALVSSLYVSAGGGWKLAFHQHSPQPPGSQPPGAS